MVDSSGLIQPLNFLYSDIDYFCRNINGSFSLYKLDLQRKYRASSVERRASSVERRASSIEHRHRTSSIEHRASSIEHRASSIGHRASGIEHRASNIEHNSGIVGIVKYQRNDGIDRALTEKYGMPPSQAPHSLCTFRTAVQLS